MTEPIASVVGGTRCELAEMSWDDYRAFPALNGSTIVHGRKSLLHLKHAWDYSRPDTPAMQYGRLVHCLLFEPAEVEARYRTWEGARRGNAYKAFYAEAIMDGAEVIKSEGEYSLASALVAAKSFLRNDRVQTLIAAGQAEQTVLGVEHGMQCKGRLDWVSTIEHTLTDLKSTAEIEPTLFGISFYRFGYDIKLGMYRRWLNAATGDNWPVEVIVLESKPPHDVAVIPAPDAVLDAGVEKALEIIRNVRTAIDTDQWPGVAGDDDLMPLKVPYSEMQEPMEEFQG